MNKLNYSIRDAEASDVPFLELMLVEAAAASGVDIEVDKLDDYPDTARYVRGFPEHREVGVIAETESGLKAGAAWIRLFSHLEEDALSPEITVSVAPDFRRQGLGTRLMDDLYNKAKGKGWKQLSLGVHKDNGAAISLYEKQGWVLRKKFGEYILMVKSL